MSTTGYINRYGVTVTLRSFTEGTKNDYGKPTKSFNDSSITMVMRILKGSERVVENGILNIEDAIGTTTEDITLKDQIIYNHRTYEISHVIPGSFGQNIVYLKKVN